MSKIVMNDPGSSQARSPLIAGLTEAVNKLSGALDLKTATLTDFPLVEVGGFMGDTDGSGKMFQAPLGNKLWLETPAPVIKKNGTVITPSADNFTIDYLGGSIVFERGTSIEDGDVITVDVTYIVDESNKLDEMADSRITEDEIDAILAQ